MNEIPRPEEISYLEECLTKMTKRANRLYREKKKAEDLYDSVKDQLVVLQDRTNPLG